MPTLGLPPQYIPLFVALWFLVAALVGLVAVAQAMRHRTIPTTLATIAFSMTLGGIFVFPDAYTNNLLGSIAKILAVFFAADIFLMSLSLRFQRIKSAN